MRTFQVEDTSDGDKGGGDMEICVFHGASTSEVPNLILLLAVTPLALLKGGDIS